MPLYEYQCPKCKSKNEQLHGMNESPTIKCPLGCKEYCVKLVIGPRQFVFKGEGTYDKGKVSHGKAKK